MFSGRHVSHIKCASTTQKMLELCNVKSLNELLKKAGVYKNTNKNISINTVSSETAKNNLKK